MVKLRSSTCFMYISLQQLNKNLSAKYKCGQLSDSAKGNDDAVWYYHNMMIFARVSNHSTIMRVSFRIKNYSEKSAVSSRPTEHDPNRWPLWVVFYSFYSYCSLYQTITGGSKHLAGVCGASSRERGESATSAIISWTLKRNGPQRQTWKTL